MPAIPSSAHLVVFFLYPSRPPPDLHSFPTRRSSDLHEATRYHTGKPLDGINPLAAGELPAIIKDRSEEHTSELQSRPHLVCRLLLEKKKQPQLPSKKDKHPFPK